MFNHSRKGGNLCESNPIQNINFSAYKSTPAWWLKTLDCQVTKSYYKKYGFVLFNPREIFKDFIVPTRKNPDNFIEKNEANEKFYAFYFIFCHQPVFNNNNADIQN
jgi:hypothetical protein